MKKIFLVYLLMFVCLLVACDNVVDDNTFYTVTFQTNGGTLIDPVSVKKGAFVNRPDDPEKEEHEFNGWFKDESLTVSFVFTAEPIMQDTTIYARWKANEIPVIDHYSRFISLPATEALPDITSGTKVSDAPDLMILGIVLDTINYYHYTTMSAFEYIKVYNNTESVYNMKNHRVMLADPLSGQNYENEDCRVGNKPLAVNHLFLGVIDEDFYIEPLSTALIWLMPYFWVAGCGSSALTATFSSDILHRDNEDQKGAISHTEADFRDYWEVDDEIPVYRLCNQPIVGKRETVGITTLFPIFSPGSGSMFTHLNSILLRGIDIAKFNNQGGSAQLNVLNKYSELSGDKQLNPDDVYGKQVFNLLEIKDGGVAVDGYLHTNVWKYWDPICRINFCGRIDEENLSPGLNVDFTVTSNQGVMAWPSDVELQFRPPKLGERLMQWQLPVREITSYQSFMVTKQLDIMRFSAVNVAVYKWIIKETWITIDLSDPNNIFDPRRHEIKSPGRLSCAAPNKIKAINLTRP